MRCLLHACCGPCSLEPVRIYQEEGVDFAIYYDNPNIHPAAEYEHRLETIDSFVVKPNGLELIEGPYDPEIWDKTAGIHAGDRQQRCRACYRLRFERLAATAAREGFDAIGTTLTISPYQYTSIIIEELELAAKRAGLVAYARDWSECYAQATKRSREMGMYRQNYCGCRFSIAEAELERRERAAAHAKAKLVKQQALLAAASQDVVNQVSQL